MVQDWLIIFNNNNFQNSSKFNIYGLNSLSKTNNSFLNNVEKGDRLWFIPSKSNREIIAVCLYEYYKKREIGPLINISKTDEELNWIGNDNWDIEIHYSNLYNLTECYLYSGIKGQTSIRKYNLFNCDINLPNEYLNILKYSRITKSF